MSNRPSAPQTSTDRPTGTYPTAPFAGCRDLTPTEELPPVAPSRPEQETPSQHGAGQDAPSIQDRGRPGILARPSMAWHPSLMQLAIGAALVAALLGACNVAAINAYRTSRAYCHALAVSDWDRAQRECRGTGASTPVPEQVETPYPSTAPSPSATPASPTGRALTRVTTPSPSPSTQPSPTSPTSPASSTTPASSWVTSDTGAPYDRTDPLASPLDLPRCTTSPGTPLPCLAHVSSDGARAVVLEEDGSMSGLVRR